MKNIKMEDFNFLPFVIYKRWHNYIRVKSAIKKADKMHSLTHKQYYVIQVFNRIRVYDRNQINYLIDYKILSPKLKDTIELRKYCLYFTGTKIKNVK